MTKKMRLPKFLRALNARRQRQAASATLSVISPSATHLRDEVDSICKRASSGDSRVIGFDKLILFSTQTGDAWMLDWEDELATCLMKAGTPQPFEFGETDRQFTIQWQGRYHIAAGLFTYIDNQTPTHARVIGGYPTEAIRQTIDRFLPGI
jgi:hypothetical protein